MNYQVNSHAAAGCSTPFPERTDVRWETTNLQVWNAQQGTTEQHDLVYEISWVEELGMWRRFLRSRRKVN